MPLEHAILAFIEFEPMSGYDLKKFFDVSDGLEKKGWAEARVIQQEGKPNRKEYHLTDAGRAELHRWLVTPLPLEPVREASLIQIFFSHSSTNAEIAALFETRVEEIQAQLHTLRTLAQAAIDENARRVGVERARQLWQITLDYGVAYYEFELAWHAKMLETIRNLPPLTLPNPPAGLTR